MVWINICITVSAVTNDVIRILEVFHDSTSSTVIFVHMPSSFRCLWPFTFFSYLYHLVHLLPSHFFGHKLHIGSVRLFSLSEVSYFYQSYLSISFSRVEFALHLPSHVKPRWATLTAHNCHYKDPECEASLRELDVTFWFFPLLFRFSAGPLLAVELDDFRVRIFNSKSTPTWIERLRRSILATILQGETIRLDVLKIKVVFSHSSPNPNPGNDSIRLADEHETRVSLSSEHWHIRGLSGRLYTFGKLEVQLRRCWVGDRGSFVLIAEECQWVKTPTFTQWKNFFNSSSWS